MSRKLPGRRREMQDSLDRHLYHPLAARVATGLASTPVTPNMVSVASGLLVVLAGVAYTQMAWPVSVLVGLSLHMGWHVLDGADGDLARLTGKVSPSGEIVDGICDYFSHLFLYILLAWFAHDTFGWIAWALAGAAAVSRVMQANYHETRRRQYLAWAHGVAWLRTSQQERRGTLGGLGSLYLRISALLAPEEKAIDSALADPARGPALRRAIASAGPEAITANPVLGANYRTLALGLSMLAGSPIWYFILEVTVLNVVLIAASLRSRRTIARLAATA
ncbi:CDP-alcohol phosphatidyltransferase family protein [Aurantiacibacter poecillastricola]|uniref:CDP-alcohol phosphatidyltransferase family protein n=1 Tax=Aurantiacibacter poecillastricola TaxID=3064385 RepID=UPI00273F28B7|nr:CDP-alcohol phosphatidyltransferase family protein [Aurantiacibacter sp. 219JJ12-13]MDP5261365.1 CDP-alcohol phosphatidyltransferase family protein [Aurantiacibacter sp. 219JJ12-13]